jgi:hypothetical protein
VSGTVYADGGVVRGIFMIGIFRVKPVLQASVQTSISGKIRVECDSFMDFG